MISLFGSNKSTQALSNVGLADRARRMLDSALKVDESSASHAYSIDFHLEGHYFDVIFNVPTSFALDSDLHKQIQKILIPGFYPLLLVYSSPAPEIVATNSGDFATARAFRYRFKLGQYRRLRFDNLDQARMEGNRYIPIMSGYNFDLLGGSSSGHVALSGVSGMGKTAMLCYMLACVINSIPDAVVKIIDPKMDYALYSFAKKRNLDYVSPRGNANDFMNDVQSILAQAVDEIHKRQREMLQTGKLNKPVYIVALDEALAVSASITDNKVIKQYQALITQICVMGRSAHVCLFMSAQTFDATSVMNSSARDQLALRVVLSANPSVNDCRFLFKEFDPSSTVITRDNFKKGLGLVSSQPDNRVIPLLAPYIKDLGA